MLANLLSRKAVRYVFAGGTGLCINIGTLYVLVQVFSVWYLIATIIAFFVATIVSFGMQKFLTFSDHAIHHAHIQLSVFLIVALCNLGVNTFLMYCLVSLVALQYLLAQFLVNAIIAIYSFFLYKHVVFKAV
jgi:putative flippase GtrA